jgi:Flp pilus assembly pilin Flp
MARLTTALRRLVLRDEGQDLLEYGLLAALIAIAAMVGVTTLGNTIYTVFWQGIGQSI